MFRQSDELLDFEIPAVVIPCEVSVMSLGVVAFAVIGNARAQGADDAGG